MAQVADRRIAPKPSPTRGPKRHFRDRGSGSPATIAAYIAPAIIGIALVNMGPILYNFYMSLTNRNGPRYFAEGRYSVTGVDNYTRILSDASFYAIFGKTLLYAVVCVALFFVVGLAFALILNNPAIKWRPLWRTLMIIPWAVPTWITALVWKFMFHGEYGPLNQMLAAVGVNGPDWLSKPFTAFVAITVVNVWMSYPFFMLVLLGGLQSISAEIYEAADLEGAGWWRQLFTITLPLLRPVALPAIILSTITNLQMFNTVWLMTKGGPITKPTDPGATELLLIWAYNQGFQGNNKRYALVAAFSIIVFIFLFCLTMIYSRLTKATKSVYE